MATMNLRSSALPGGWHSGLILTLAILMLPGCIRLTTQPTRAVALWRQTAPQSSDGRGKTADASPAQRIDLKKALEMLSRDNLSLRALEAQVQQARARQSAATELDNPEVRIRSVELDKIAADAPVVDLAMRVPIPKPWLLDARSRRAALETQTVKARVDRARRQLRTEVRRLFAELGLLEQEEAHMQRTSELLSRLLKLVAKRLEAGVATKVDHTTATLAHAEALDRLEKLLLKRARISQRLRQALGIRAMRKVVFTPRSSRPPIADTPQSEKALVRQALERRPELKQAAARVGIAKANAYIARSKQIPWLRFAEVNYGFTPELDPLNFDFSVAVELPVFSWSTNRIKAREAAVSRRKLEEQALIADVAREVSRARAEVKMTARRLKAMGRTLLPALEKADKVLDEATKTGTIDPLAAITAEIRRINAQRRHLKALQEHEMARIELDSAVAKE